MRPDDLVVALSSRSRLHGGRPSGYLTRTLERLDEIADGKLRVLVMDASIPGETHEELESARHRFSSWMEVIQRPRLPVEDQVARSLISEARLATLPEAEVTWGVQITRDFLDLMRAASKTGCAGILRIEDDVEAAEDLLMGAASVLDRHPGRPFVSLFSPRIRLDGGWTRYHCHAQAIAFRNNAWLPEMLEQVEERDGQNLFDVLIADYRTPNGRGGIVSYPSLVQHFGETRSQPGSPPREPLVSPTYRRQHGGLPGLRPARLMWMQLRRWLGGG